MTSEVIETLKSKLEEQETLKPEDVKNILTDVLGGQPNMAAIKSAIEESVKSHKPSEGVSKEEFESAVADIKKSFNAGRKNVFDAGNGNQGVVEYPIEHRSGNLSVAQKQLFNIMLNATPGLKEHQIEKISNEGIPEEALRQAKAVGSSNLQRLRKALTTGGSNSGAELIAQDLSSELLNRMYLESQVAAEFISAEIDMPTQSFVLPIRTTRPTFVAGSENPGSNPAESSPGTDDVTLTAAKLIGRTNFSYEADEDAIVPVLNMVTNNLASAAADALENAIINGDTAASQDSDASAGDDVTLFDGIRKYALGGSTDRSLATGGISTDNLLSLKKDMKKFGLRPQDVLIIAGVNGYNDLLALDETLTADLTGNPATARVLSGLAPTILGSRIVTSSRVREDLNADGAYDGTTTTKGSIFMVHRPSWIMGVKRGFTVEIDRDVQKQVNIVVASFRRDFKPMETPSASLPYVVMGRNYDS